MTETIQKFITLSKNNPDFFMVVLSVLTALVISAHIKRMFSQVIGQEMVKTNSALAFITNVLCVVMLYGGPNPLMVAGLCGVFGPVLFVIIEGVIEQKATTTGGAWLAVLKWLKPHRVNPSGYKKHSLSNQGCDIVQHGKDTVAVKRQVEK